MFLAFLLATVVYAYQFRQESPAPFPEGLAVLQMAIEMVLPLPVHAFGLVLGAVSAFFPSRQKLFPLLGMFLNAVFGLISLFPWLYLIFHSLGRVQ